MGMNEERFIYDICLRVGEPISMDDSDYWTWNNGEHAKQYFDHVEAEWQQSSL